MATIDGLFEQIICSEEAALQRKNLLHDLRQEVCACQERAKQLEKFNAELENKLRNKLTELCEYEQTAKLLENQEQIYREEKAEVEQRLEELTEKEEAFKNQIVHEKQRFCEQLSSLCAAYGLDSTGFHDRESDRQEKLDKLKHQTANLSSSLGVHQERQSAVNRLQEQKDNLMQQIQHLQEEKQNEAAALKEEQQRTIELENECEIVTDFNNKDPQFTSLQTHLEEEKSASTKLGNQCTQEQAKLHQLHQVLWQRQIQQRQQQQQKQKQTGAVHVRVQMLEDFLSDTSLNQFGGAEDSEDNSESSATSAPLHTARKRIFRCNNGTT